MDREGTVRLLTAILTDQPKLDGAACVGHHRTYDPLPRVHQFQRQEQLRRTEAARICAGCPVIRRCPSATITTEKAA